MKLKSPILWLCGQTDENNNDIWGVVGIFTSEKKAVAACRDEYYFVSPYKINEADYDDAIHPDPIGYYPLAKEI